MDLLRDWVSHRAAVIPDRDAVIAGPRAISYAELEQRVRGLAGALAAAGIAQGDRVAILAQNSVEMVEAIHAIPRLGAVCVPLNTRLAQHELAFQLDHAGVRAVLCHAPTAGLARSVTASLGRDGPLQMPVPPGPATATADTYAAGTIHSIIYTSGTTGRPRGAMLTFGNFWASAVGSAFNLGVTPDDRWLVCLPLFHVGGLSIVLRSAIYGTAFVLHASFDESEVVRSLYQDRVTLVSVVPTMLERILDVDERRAPPALRVVLVGGGPVPLHLLERALARGFPVVQTYGLTEAASQVATLAPGDAMSHAGSAGKALITTRLRVDADQGQAGEIIVSGPTVSPGYFRDPAATTDTIRDGWLHTGDIGYEDREGFLFVLDRRSDLIISGGENVYPAEVEAAMLGFPGVRGAAVVGQPDSTWGQAVVGAVVADGPVDLEELRLWLRSRLAGYKVPRRLVRVEALPATASGKVQRHLVREMLDHAGE